MHHSVIVYTFLQVCNSLSYRRDLKKSERVAVAQPRPSTNQIRSDDYTALVGHAGPVYGAAFSPDQQFVLSCSEDCTVR